MAKKKSKYSAKTEEIKVADNQLMESLTSVVKAEMDDARDFIFQVGEERAESTEYYLGEEPDTTSDLQSSYVSTDVRDSILFMLPSIMRTFFGAKKVVEFIPKNAEDIPIAQQQTDYINWIVQQKNPGFHVMYNTFKDALIRKTGFLKVYWDDTIGSTTHEYTELDPQSYQALMIDPDVELVSEEIVYETIMQIDPMTQEEITQEIPASYDVVIRRITSKDQVCIESIPPEEVLVARHARDLESASYVAHRMVKTVSDLVAMGYDEEEIKMYQGSGATSDPETYEEQQARNPLDNLVYPDRTDAGGKDVLYVEHYLFFDLDEDGIDERVRVCTIGDAANIVNVMPWDELPIIDFCPDPEPHTAIGSCPADYLKPIQAAKSQIMRDTLDSLGHSVFPRMAIVEGQVNIDDVLNTDIGQPIRMRAPGMVQPMSIPFVGKEAFPVLNYIDIEKENRTGVSKASAGLNADALQSSTKTAVAATMSGAQGRVELICRHFAEGMKRLFSLTNHLVVKHQRAQDIFRLNGKFIPVDPRVWDSNKDIAINVAITKSSDEEKASILQGVASKQEMLLQSLGPSNPVVSLQQYVNTLTKYLELAGFKDPESFFNTEVQPMPPQPEQPSAEEQLAQAEMRKAEAQATKALLDAETDRMKIIMDDDRERDIKEAEIRLKVAELQARHGAQINVAEINALMERDREMIRGLAKAQAQGLMRTNGTGQ